MIACILAEKTGLTRGFGLFLPVLPLNELDVRVIRRIHGAKNVLFHFLIFDRLPHSDGESPGRFCCFNRKNAFVAGKPTTGRVAMSCRFRICLLFFAFLAAGPLFLRGQENGGVVSFATRVASERAPVCSAPGEEHYYQTGTLKGGDTVEVFFRTADGWCAIRPPEGSFSWVNGSFLELGNDSTGVIVSPEAGKEVPVRVGADSVLKSSGVQVGLSSGRRVRVLGSTTLTGGKTWYKISPPAGEFRWIHERDLERDELIAKLPNRLVREGESSNFENAINKNAQNPQAENAFAASEQNERPAESINPRSDSFNDGFRLELARLNRDLFSAMENDAAPEAFDLLTDRAALLYDIAANDDQRAEIQKIYDQTESYRASKLAPAPLEIRTVDPAAGLYATETLYRHPGAANLQSSAVPSASRENERIAFQIPQRQTTGQGVRQAAPKTASAKENKNGIRFAFAGGNHPFSKLGKTGGKQGTTVPPANYLPTPAGTRAPSVAPPIISDGLTAPRNGSTKSEAAPALPGPEADRTESSGKSSERPPFLAEESASGEKSIRPVAAFVPPEGINNEKTVPGSTDEKSTTTNRPNADAAFDASGTLGYFPDRPDGYPPYALVRNKGGELVILCYVVPDRGKSLDAFVGKTIGVSGTKGWFKRGEENRKMITVKAIHLLD